MCVTLGFLVELRHVNDAFSLGIPRPLDFSLCFCCRQSLCSALVSYDIFRPPYFCINPCFSQNFGLFRPPCICRNPHSSKFSKLWPFSASIFLSETISLSSKLAFVYFQVAYRAGITFILSRKKFFWTFFKNKLFPK